jgi:hypothetical protein
MVEGNEWMDRRCSAIKVDRYAVKCPEHRLPVSEAD